MLFPRLFSFDRVSAECFDKWLKHLEDQWYGNGCVIMVSSNTLLDICDAVFARKFLVHMGLAIARVSN